MGTGMGGSVRVWHTSPGVHDRGGDQPFERRVLSLLLNRARSESFLSIVGETYSISKA